MGVAAAAWDEKAEDGCRRRGIRDPEGSDGCRLPARCVWRGEVAAAAAEAAAAAAAADVPFQPGRARVPAAKSDSLAPAAGSGPSSGLLEDAGAG